MCKAVRLRGERSAGPAGRGAGGLQSRGTRRPEGFPSEQEMIPLTSEVMGAHGGGAPWRPSPREASEQVPEDEQALATMSRRGGGCCSQQAQGSPPHAREPVPGTGLREEKLLLQGRPARQREAGLRSVSPSWAPGEMVGVSAPDLAGPRTVRFWKLPAFRFRSVLVLWFQGGEFRAHKGYVLVLLRGWGSVSLPCGCPAPGEGGEPAAGGPLRSRSSFCPGSREGPGPAAAS